jgi:MFS family permease
MLPYTLTMVGFALGNFLIGRAVDRFGITSSLIAATIGLVASTVVAAAAQSILILSLAQLVIGFGTAVCFGPLIADISQWFMQRRGIAVAIAACGNYLSGAIWPMLLSGVLVDYGWRTVYQVLAVIAVVSLIPLSLLLRRKMPMAEANRAEAVAAMNRASISLIPKALQWWLSLAGVGCCVAMSMPQVHIVALCNDLGFGTGVGAKMLSLMLMGGVVSRLIFGLLSDQLGGVKTLLISGIMQCVALFLYIPFNGPVSLYLVSLAFGLSQGGIVPAYAVIVREFLPAKEAGARVGFVLMATIFGMALGGWVSGWIYDLTGSYDLAFLHGIAWNFLNIGIILMVFLRSRPRALAL